MKQFRKILNCIFALIAVFMLITVIGMKENSTYTKDVFNEDLSDGWMLSQSDGTRSEITLPYKYQDGNSDVQIIRVLPQVPEHAVLQIMCNYQSLRAYVDGEEIFHALPSTFGMIKTDMGHYVALIPLSSEYSGKELVLHITERESGYRSEIGYIRLTSIAQYAFQILEEDAFHLIVSIVLMFCAVCLLVTWLMLGGKSGTIPEETYHPLLWLSLFTASVGVWFFSEAYVWAIATGRFAASGTLNYMALSLMPLSLLGVLKSICTEKLVSLQWIVITAKIALIAEWSLFLTGLVDFSGMLPLLQTECIIAMSIFAVFLVWKHKLFVVGEVVRYSIWILPGMLFVTIIAYILGTDWLSWALGTALVLLALIIISTFLRVSRALKDISQTKQYKEYALTDIMTGLKSRYAYTIFEAQQKVGLPSESLSLIFLDIDLMKTTNDTLGHVAGDEMIVAVSECIKNAFGDVAECFRMGGDEFLVALTEEPDVVQKRIAQFERLISQWSGRYVSKLTVSYGIAEASKYPNMNFEELLKKADYMMYQHKKTSR